MTLLKLRAGLSAHAQFTDVLVPVERVSYVFKDGAYAALVMVDGSCLRTHETIEAVAAMLSTPADRSAS